MYILGLTREIYMTKFVANREEKHNHFAGRGSE